MEPTISHINDWECIHFECIDSTNRYATSIAPHKERNKFVVIADSQTGGYGRSKKNWESSSQKGLWMSVVVPVFIDIEKLSQSTLVLAVAVQHAIYKVSGLHLKIKWPNDLLSLEGKKCAGLLVENVMLDDAAYLDLQQHVLVLGIGLNVEHDSSDFSEEINQIATSLYIQTQNKFNKSLLISELLNSITSYFEIWEKKGFTEIKRQWLQHSCSIGKEILFSIDNKKQEGTILGLSDTGELLVNLPNGMAVSIDSGEIAFKS